MAELATFIAFIILYIIGSFLNPMARLPIQHIALLKYKEGRVMKFKLIYSNKRILKELIYTKNLNHLDIPVAKFEEIYFFNKQYELKNFDGNHVRRALQEDRREILDGLSSNFLNIYNNYAVKRFVSQVRGDYEENEITEQG